MCPCTWSESPALLALLGVQVRSRWCTRRQHICLARFLAELKAPSSLCLPFAGSLLGACHQSQSMQQAMHALAPCSTMHHVGCRTKWAINSVLYVGGLATNVLRALCTAWGNAVCILHSWMLHIPCVDAACSMHGYCIFHAWVLYVLPMGTAHPRPTRGGCIMLHAPAAAIATLA